MTITPCKTGLFAIALLAMVWLLQSNAIAGSGGFTDLYVTNKIYHAVMPTNTGARGVCFGAFTYSAGDDSMAIGNLTRALGFTAHAQGYRTEARGNASHAEGANTAATGTWAHAEGYVTVAAQGAHAEGKHTEAHAAYSHSGGEFARVLGTHTGAFIHAQGASSNSMKQTQFKHTAHFDRLHVFEPANDHTNSVLARWENDLRYLQPVVTVTTRFESTVWVARQGDISMGVFTNGP
jgi:hypothetical protein